MIPIDPCHFEIAASSPPQDVALSNQELLATLSYAVRTPMNGLIGMAQLALETHLTSEQRDYIAAAASAAESLLKALTDILEISQMEAGEFRLARREFAITETLYEVMCHFAPAAREKGLTLLLDLDKSFPTAVIGDQERFRQVIVNLVGNAIKFTDAGKVTLHGVPVFHSEEVVGLHLVVSDTGRGIANDGFEQAVQPFGQVPAPNTNLSGGADLSLAVASRLIGMIGGCLWPERAPGLGSIVHFTATFGKSSAPVLSPDCLGNLRGANILIADNSAICRRSIQQLLARYQVEATPAGSWPEALNLMLSTAAGGKPFDVLLVARPVLGLDGSELLKAIEENPELGTPEIIVLQSESPVSFTDLANELCPRSHLVKPVSEFTFLNSISAAIRGKRARTTHAGGSVCEPGKAAHILVADDDVLTRSVTVNTLKKAGYRVSLARNGPEAVEAFDRSGLDLVLMDVQMPDLDGLDTTRLIRLKESGTGRHVPILAITAHAMAGDRDRCLAAGMDDYVSKPYTPSHLRETVCHWLAASQGPSPDQPTPVVALGT